MTRNVLVGVHGYISCNSCSLGGVIETLNPGAQADETRFGRVLLPSTSLLSGINANNLIRSSALRGDLLGSMLMDTLRC